MFAPGRRWRAAGALAAAVALAVGYMAGGRVAPNGINAGVRELAAPATATALAGYRTVRDKPAAFQVAYPRSWARIYAVDQQIRLLVRDGDAASVLVRVSRLGFDAGSRRAEVLGDLAEQLVVSTKRVRLLAPRRRLEISGLPAFLYLYSQTDAARPRRWLHWHVLVFAGRRMYALVFQTAPTGGVERYAAIFDAILASFRVTRS